MAEDVGAVGCEDSGDRRTGAAGARVSRRRRWCVRSDRVIEVVRDRKPRRRSTRRGQRPPYSTTLERGPSNPCLGEDEPVRGSHDGAI